MKNTQLVYILIAILYAVMGYLLYVQFKKENYASSQIEGGSGGSYQPAGQK